MRTRWPGFLLFAALLAVWEISSACAWVDTISVPRVTVIFSSWIDIITHGELVRQLIASLGRIFAGFGMAVVIAVPLGLLMGSVTIVYRLLEPVSYTHLRAHETR